MRITHFYSNNSQAKSGMQYDLLHGKVDLHEAYIKPSQAKINSFDNIRQSYYHNEVEILGVPCKEIIVPKAMKKLNNKMYARYINGTLVVATASSHFYTTCAIFEDIETNKRYIIKETHCNTYMCELD